MDGETEDSSRDELPCVIFDQRRISRSPLRRQAEEFAIEMILAVAAWIFTQPAPGLSLM